MNIRKKALILASLVTCTPFFNGCSTFLKNLINSSEQGKGAIQLVKSSYTSPKKEDLAKIKIPENFSQKISKGQVKEVLLFIHGYSADSSKWGESSTPDSPLSIANRLFDNNVLLADYSSFYKIPEISKQILSEIEKISLNSEGKLPKLKVFALSMGGDVARYMVREKPNYFEEVNLIATPMTGVSFGTFNSYLTKNYPEILGLEKELVQNIDDLFVGSDFLNELNTPKKLGALSEGDLEKKIKYNIYMLDSKKNNFFIKGKDDGLVAIHSAYPYKEISEGKFEDVDFGYITIFQGDVNHHSSIYNPFIMEYILTNSKNGKLPIKRIPTLEEVSRIEIIHAPKQELEYRKLKNKKYLQ